MMKSLFVSTRPASSIAEDRMELGGHRPEGAIAADQRPWRPIKIELRCNHPAILSSPRE
jgi:hypothetical protein